MQQPSLGRLTLALTPLHSALRQVILQSEGKQTKAPAMLLTALLSYFKKCVFRQKQKSGLARCASLICYGGSDIPYSNCRVVRLEYDRYLKLTLYTVFLRTISAKNIFFEVEICRYFLIISAITLLLCSKCC